MLCKSEETDKSLRMKRLLFYSFISITLAFASCSGNGKASAGGNSTEPSSAERTEVLTTPKQAVQDSELNSPGSSEYNIEKVHEHSGPNQSGLDSVKNSYPKKK